MRNLKKMHLEKSSDDQKSKMAAGWIRVVKGKAIVNIFQMCPKAEKNEVKAYYIADDIYEISLPEHLDQLLQLGEIPEEGIIGYIIIANGEEITIIADEEAYIAWMYFA